MNSDAVDVEVQMSLWSADIISFGPTLSSGIAGLYGTFIFNFLSNLVSIVASLIYIPTHSVQSSLFSTCSSASVTCVFDNSHSYLPEVISHCSFDLHFLNTIVFEQCSDQWHWSYFGVLIFHLYIYPLMNYLFISFAHFLMIMWSKYMAKAFKKFITAKDILLLILLQILPLTSNTLIQPFLAMCLYGNKFFFLNLNIHHSSWPPLVVTLACLFWEFFTYCRAFG